MKKISSFLLFLCIVLMLFLVLPQSTDASSFREVKAVSANGGAILRQNASPSAKSLGTLAKGTFVTQFEVVSGGWSKVKVGNKSGYIAFNSLSEPKSTIKIASSKSGLIVKETASRSAKTFATLKYNMIVNDFGSVGGGWSFVQYGNVTGYVATSFINTPKVSSKIVGYTNGSISVRNIASPSGEHTGYLNPGTQVNVFATLSGWTYVKAGTTEGYVVASQLTAKPPAKSKITGGLVPNKKLKLSYYFNDNYYYNLTYMPRDYRGYGWNLPSDPIVGLVYDEDGKSFTLGVDSTDWTIVDYDLPFTVGKKLPVRYFDYDLDKYIVQGYNYVTSLTDTVTVDAGTFYNVVTIKTESGYVHIAPGYGIIKITANGDTFLELIQVR